MTELSGQIGQLERLPLQRLQINTCKCSFKLSHFLCKLTGLAGQLVLPKEKRPLIASAWCVRGFRRIQDSTMCTGTPRMPELKVKNSKLFKGPEKISLNKDFF